MQNKNPFLAGKLTDRIKAISNLKETEVLMLRAQSPEQFKAHAETYRQYFIDMGLMIYSAMEEILDKTEELVREEYSEFMEEDDENLPDPSD